MKAAHKVLSDEEKPLIAQTLARLHNSACNFTEAIEWARQAIKDAQEYSTQNEFACRDTLGQIHKRNLRNIHDGLINVSSGSYEVNDLTKALECASLACNNFQAARELFKKSLGFDSKEWNEYEKRDFFTQRLQSDSCALDGIIETTLVIINLVLNTSLFKGRKIDSLFLESVRRGSFSIGELMRQFKGLSK